MKPGRSLVLRAASSLDKRRHRNFTPAGRVEELTRKGKTSINLWHESVPSHRLASIGIRQSDSALSCRMVCSHHPKRVIFFLFGTNSSKTGRSPKDLSSIALCRVAVLDYKTLNPCHDSPHFSFFPSLFSLFLFYSPFTFFSLVFIFFRRKSLWRICRSEFLAGNALVY